MYLICLLSDYFSFCLVCLLAGTRLIARAICEDMQIWKEGKNQPTAVDKVHIGDPIAAYLAYFPEVS